MDEFTRGLSSHPAKHPVELTPEDDLELFAVQLHIAARRCPDYSTQGTPFEHMQLEHKTCNECFFFGAKLDPSLEYSYICLLKHSKKQIVCILRRRWKLLKELVE